MAKKRRKSGSKRNKNYGVVRPEPNMPTLNELVDIGIRRQVDKVVRDSNKEDEFYRRMRETAPLMITESVPSARQRWFHDQYIQAKRNKPVEPKPSEVPTYPAAQPRKMRIKP